MNVALPNGQRPTQTKATAKGDMQGRPAAPGSKPKNFTRGETTDRSASALDTQVLLVSLYCGDHGSLLPYFVIF
ncbi:hypothetical protein NQZ68_004393 [Dissostichus eleginoides]|nr:hypothetical protein NQZ68_004393 [Dissostichus eleginoides]